MIRPFTLVTMLLAAGSGAYLFAVKHQAQVLDDQLAATANQSRLDAQRIRVLQAQWALEIDPSRLNQLATQFTVLQPMKPEQLVTLASLQTVLPPAGSNAPAPNPDVPGSAIIITPAVVADNAVADGAPTASALPPPADAPPAASAAARPGIAAHHGKPAASRLASAEAVLRGMKHSRPVYLARAGQSVLRLADARDVADMPPPRPLFTSSPVMPMGAQVMSVRAEASPSYPPPPSGSMLGMATNLAPPQPLGGAEN